MISTLHIVHQEELNYQPFFSFIGKKIGETALKMPTRISFRMKKATAPSSVESLKRPWKRVHSPHALAVPYIPSNISHDPPQFFSPRRGFAHLQTNSAYILPQYHQNSAPCTAGTFHTNRLLICGSERLPCSTSSARLSHSILTTWPAAFSLSRRCQYRFW